MRWMKLELTIQSEVSQKEKHQYSILTHIYGISNIVMIIPYARQQKRHRCTEQSLDSVGEGDSGMIWENGIETYNIIYEMSRQSRFDA